MTEVDEALAKVEHAPAPEGDARVPEPELEPKGEADAQGRQRPAFLLGFPDHPELRTLMRAFEVGNYAAVRLGAPKLAESSEDPKVRAAARELRRRIDPDPLMKYLLWVAIILFLFVVWYSYQNHSR